MNTAEILSKPYVRQVVPQPDGVFKAEILEFPGCFAIGDTAAEALMSLEEVAADWLTATIDQGQDIPEPTESGAFSGKFVTRMAKSLHRKASQFAQRDGVSLNQFIVNCVAEHVGMRSKPSHAISVDLNLKVLTIPRNVHFEQAFSPAGATTAWVHAKTSSSGSLVSNA